MYKHNDLANLRFGRLYVVSDIGRTKDRHILWHCVCDCGNSVNVSSHDLLNGHTQSCGCLQKARTHEARYIHGDRDARLYKIWQSMKKRCESPQCKSFRWYGAKGVTVCDEWHEYSAFKEWAVQNGYNENAKYGECTIDRIDPFGNYEPQNCRWVSFTEQAKNKRK